jgi:PAS domain S-box-containing protein
LKHAAHLRSSSHRLPIPARLSRAELQIVLETMADGLIVADGEANILYMNPEALSIHGFASVDQARRNLNQWPEFESCRLDGSVLPVEETALARVTRGESFRDYEYEVRNNETGAAWIGSFNATPVLDESGAVVLTVLSLRDVTEHRQAEEALRRSVDRYRALAEESERLYRQQLEIAESLQTALLSIPSEIGAVRLAHLYRSATEAARVGGDFYDAFEVKDGKIAILVGDVAGHGIEAARTATLVKDVVHAFTHQSLRSHKVMSRANAVLMERLLPGFVTLFLAILDTETGLLGYANAGHPPPMLRRASGGIERLGDGSVPLGVRAEVTWKPGEARLEAGDILLLYTDGIVEARRGKEFFGDERLEKLLKRKRLSVERLPGLILDQVLAFSEGKLTDDIAVLAVELTRPPERADA